MKTHYKKIFFAAGLLVLSLSANAVPPVNTGIATNSQSTQKQLNIQTIQSFDVMLSSENLRVGNVFLLDWDNCCCTTSGKEDSYEKFSEVLKEKFRQCIKEKEVAGVLPAGLFDQILIAYRGACVKAGGEVHFSEAVRPVLASLAPGQVEMVKDDYALCAQEAYAAFVHKQESASVKMTHEGVGTLFRALQQGGAHYILFTSRNPSEAGLVMRQVQQLELSLSCPLQPFGEFPQGSLYDPRGVLLCGLLNRKSDILSHGCKVLKERLRGSGKVIYVDDSLKHLLDVAQLLKEWNIPYQCYYYPFKRSFESCSK